MSNTDSCDDEHSTRINHQEQMAAIATRLSVQMKFGEVDKVRLREDLESQFGTREIEEAKRRLALLNDWLENNN